jgi:hypothetical protein
MKPLSPHDPLDDLIAAALHGELTPEERAQFDARLQFDPAAHAAYHKAQAMHDLLEKTHQEAQPDPAFEQRMVSGVRRKIQDGQHRETPWESLLALWLGLKRFFAIKRQPTPLWSYLRSAVFLIFVIAVLAGVALGPITNGIKQSPANAEMQRERMLQFAVKEKDEDSVDAPIQKAIPAPGAAAGSGGIVPGMGGFSQTGAGTTGLNGANTYTGGASTLTIADGQMMHAVSKGWNEDRLQTRNIGARLPIDANSSSVSDSATPQGGTERGAGFHAPTTATSVTIQSVDASTPAEFADANGTPAPMAPDTASPPAQSDIPRNDDSAWAHQRKTDQTKEDLEDARLRAPADGSASAATTPTVADTRKLIRNAQLDLEVKSFPAVVDEITALTNTAGGYVDTSNSQRGGNGKLQGTVVVKILPQNLDAFLLKLRGLGEVQNQSVSTDDVTKEYYDTQARLDNSRRMETQLQDLLKHANSKVSDLLQVERELGRVRGDIEQMQGQLKLYDFQVQYATVTMQIHEKDLNEAAAYLLKEQDDFSLFSTNVEATFEKARAVADQFKAQVLTADLNHNSGSDVSAELVVMVAPDQIEPFLDQVRALGRVANFTRQTQRVARDGGDSDHPADQTLTEKDKVQVHLAIRSDDDSRKQVALTVVAKAVDDVLDQAKTAALAQAGVEILSSSLNKAPQGESTAQLSVRVPGHDYDAVIAAFEKLGRTASLSIQRQDNSGPGANGDDAPVIISLSLTDNDTPLQETEMSVVATDVDAQAQEIKRDAAGAGVEVKASSFERQPDGTEIAQMVFRLPMSKYPAFVETLKKLGRVESLSVRRDDRPDQTRTDETAPAEISLQLHNQGEIVPDNSGLWATLRQTFGEGAAALFGSVRVIGVLIAFAAPWVFTLILAAWIGRRIYIARKNR